MSVLVPLFIANMTPQVLSELKLHQKSSDVPYIHIQPCCMKYICGQENRFQISSRFHGVLKVREKEEGLVCVKISSNLGLPCGFIIWQFDKLLICIVTLYSPLTDNNKLKQQGP